MINANPLKLTTANVTKKAGGSFNVYLPPKTQISIVHDGSYIGSNWERSDQGKGASMMGSVADAPQVS